MRSRIPTLLTAILGAALIVTTVAPQGGGANPVDNARAAADAATRDAEARRRTLNEVTADANRLAAQLLAQMSQVDKLDDAIAASESKAKAAETRMTDLQQRFRARAVLLYQQAGTKTIDLQDSDSLESVLDELRLRFFAERSTNDERRNVNELRLASEKLRDEQARLAGLRKSVAGERDRLNRANRELQTKLAAARSAQQEADAARARQVKALRDAEARARAAQNAEAAAQFANRRVAAESGSNRTVNGIRCPIAGPVSFRNDWGDPRSGGRRHAGTDLFSPLGTPNVAVISGSVFTQVERVGGLSVYLQGNDGNTYYYTHLSRFGASGSVNAGDVVGYTGGTGNANGVVHTHFEIRLGGPNGTKINPYPTLSAVC